MTNMTALLMKQMLQDAEHQGATLAFDTSTVEDQGERWSALEVLGVYSTPIVHWLWLTREEIRKAFTVVASNLFSTMSISQAMPNALSSSKQETTRGNVRRQTTIRLYLSLLELYSNDYLETYF